MPDMWLDQAPDGKKFAVAIGAGLALELAALMVLLPMLSQAPPPAQIPAPVKITIVAPPTPKPPPPVAKPQPPHPVAPKQPVAPPKPLPPPPRPSPHHVFRHVTPPRPIAPPPPQVQQPPTPQAPPPPAPAAPSQGEVDLFRLAMRAAVQQVADEVYPQAAQMAHETGTPEVSFTYFDGVVSAVSLVRTCGYPLLDAAAMQAVRIAHYPAEPANFRGQPHQVTVEVIFQLGAASVDGD